MSLVGRFRGRPRHVQQKLEHFEFYRRSADMPNAVATLDEAADDLYAELRVEQALRIDRPSIVASFMPKSGGTFLHSRLVRDCGYAVYHWAVANPLATQAVYASTRALRNYLRGGCTSHTHFLPTPHNLAAFRNEGVSRVWVHVRHPCEVVQSAYFHYAGQGQGEGSVGRERVAETVEEVARLGLDVDPADAEKRRAFFREQLPWIVDWLRMWAVHAEAKPDFVHLTSHRGLVDPAGLLRGVFARFGVPLSVESVRDRLPEDRVRSNHSADWRDGLDRDTVGFAVALLEQRLDPQPWLRELCGIGA